MRGDILGRRQQPEVGLRVDYGHLHPRAPEQGDIILIILWHIIKYSRLCDDIVLCYIVIYWRDHRLD